MLLLGLPICRGMRRRRLAVPPWRRVSGPPGGAARLQVRRRSISVSWQCCRQQGGRASGLQAAYACARAHLRSRGRSSRRSSWLG